MIRRSALAGLVLVLLAPGIASAVPPKPMNPGNGGFPGIEIFVVATMALPVFVAYLFFIWLFQRSSRGQVRNYMKRADEHLTLSQEHMRRLESQNDQMIALLRMIDAKLDN